MLKQIKNTCTKASGSKIMIIPMIILIVLMAILPMVSAGFGINSRLPPEVTIISSSGGVSIPTCTGDDKITSSDGTNLICATDQTSAGGVFNQTYHDTTSAWDGNFTDYSEYWYNHTLDVYSLWNDVWLSTYNVTYDTWAYNQTTPAITSSNTYTDTSVGTADLHTHNILNLTGTQDATDCGGTDKVTDVIITNGVLTTVCEADETSAGGGNPFNQVLNTTSNVTFDYAFFTGDINVSNIFSLDWANVTILETQITDADWWDADGDVDADEISESKINFATSCSAGEYYRQTGNDLECTTPTDTTDDNVDSGELDNICNTDDRFLKRTTGTWGCYDYSAWDQDASNDLLTSELPLENRTLSAYQNITNFPTCAGTDKFSFDGTDLTCETDEDTDQVDSLTEGLYCRADATPEIDCDVTGDATGTCGANNVCLGGHTHPATEITAGAFGTGAYTFDDNITVEGVKFEVDPTNHRIYDNATCVMISGDTADLWIC